jgi:hypothetical protein
MPTQGAHIATQNYAFGWANGIELPHPGGVGTISSHSISGIGRRRCS